MLLPLSRKGLATSLLPLHAYGYVSCSSGAYIASIHDRLVDSSFPTEHVSSHGTHSSTCVCLQRIKALKAKSGKAELRLRLSVEGGGCSGFQYTFTMDDGPVNEDDKYVDDVVTIRGGH